MIKISKYLIFIIFIFFQKADANEEINFFKEINPINQDGSLNIIVEISVGDTIKRQLSEDKKKLEIEYNSTGKRLINYIPYPFNYGVIPQTLESFKIRADGDPLDVILIGSKKKKAELEEGNILGIIYMMDGMEIDNKILAISQQDIFLDINNIFDLEKKYPGVIEIIKIWLKNYKGGYVEIKNINGKKRAKEYINDSNSRYLSKNGS